MLRPGLRTFIIIKCTVNKFYRTFLKATYWRTNGCAGVCACACVFGCREMFVLYLALVSNNANRLDCVSLLCLMREGARDLGVLIELPQGAFLCGEEGGN